MFPNMLKLCYIKIIK